MHVTYYPVTLADLGKSGSNIGRPLPRPAGLPRRRRGPSGPAGRNRRDARRRPRRGARLSQPPRIDRGNGSSPIRTARAGFTAAAISPASARTAISNIRAAATTRSRCVASASSCPRSNRHWRVIPRSGNAPSFPAPMRASSRGWFPISWRRRGNHPAWRTCALISPARCPEYMIPAVFVFLPSFPLTINGKLDRAALPAPGSDRPALAATFIAPKDDLEKTLARLWKTVLRQDAVGIERQFLRLGRRFAPPDHAAPATAGGAEAGDSDHRSFPVPDHPPAGRASRPQKRTGRPGQDGGPGPTSTRCFNAGAPGGGAMSGEPNPLGEGIAIIGMAGKFPGAPDLEAFWRNVRNGVESVTRFTDEELDAPALAPGEPELCPRPRHHRGGRPLRRRVLRPESARGRVHRPAAPASARDRLGGAGERGLRSGTVPGHGRRLRRVQSQQLPPAQPELQPRLP